MICILCNEEIASFDAWVPLNAVQYAHHCCSLREVMGGIGHLIAHDYWCGDPRHDPDAGLTYHQSAKLVSEFVSILGVEEAVARGR